MGATLRTNLSAGGLVWAPMSEPSPSLRSYPATSSSLSPAGGGVQHFPKSALQILFLVRKSDTFCTGSARSKTFGIFFIFSPTWKLITQSTLGFGPAGPIAGILSWCIWVKSNAMKKNQNKFSSKSKRSASALTNAANRKIWIFFHPNETNMSGNGKTRLWLDGKHVSPSLNMNNVSFNWLHSQKSWYFSLTVRTGNQHVRIAKSAIATAWKQISAVITVTPNHHHKRECNETVITLDVFFDVVAPPLYTREKTELGVNRTKK